jgi:hypothetical protein
MFGALQARTSLEPTELLKGEAAEALPRVKKALDVLYALRDAYDEHLVKVPNYFKDRQPLEWNFPPSMIFHRLDKFVKLLETVQVSSLKHQ